MSFDATAFQQFEHQGWNQKAAGYHDLYGPIVAPAVEAALDRVKAGPGSRLLDVGSGPGYVAAAAARRGSEVVGVDFSESMVSLARELHPGLAFEVADAQDLPFPEGSFDAAIASFALHHVPRQDDALAELARVLRPAGRLGMTAWDAPDRNRFLGVFVDAILQAGAPLPPDVPAGPPMYSEDDDYSRQLMRAGFVDPFVDRLTHEHRFESPSVLWDGLMRASVRTAAMIEHQPAAVRGQIRSRFDALIEAYTNGGSVLVPVSVLVIGGVRPAE